MEYISDTTKALIVRDSYNNSYIATTSSTSANYSTDINQQFFCVGNYGFIYLTVAPNVTAEMGTCNYILRDSVPTDAKYTAVFKLYNTAAPNYPSVNVTGWTSTGSDTSYIKVEFPETILMTGGTTFYSRLGTFNLTA